ncbi:unnamed protein product [Prorocentrum cordatum]|uniref:Mono(ADP-ribosyl)transferase n=1 Tax=Prorocentrum cordatum TaxID=2364126 RepID=A0ABN9WZN7_9DINO|nr:unnamed protein product [Polarella glacialis]
MQIRLGLYRTPKSAEAHLRMGRGGAAELPQNAGPQRTRCPSTFELDVLERLPWLREGQNSQVEAAASAGRERAESEMHREAGGFSRVLSRTEQPKRATSAWLLRAEAKHFGRTLDLAGACFQPCTERGMAGLDEACLSRILSCLNDVGGRLCCRAWAAHIYGAMGLEHRIRFAKAVARSSELSYHHSTVRDFGGVEECLSFSFCFRQGGTYSLQWFREGLTSDNEQQLGRWRVVDDAVLCETVAPSSPPDERLLRFAGAGRTFRVPVADALLGTTSAEQRLRGWEPAARGLPAEPPAAPPAEPPAPAADAAALAAAPAPRRAPAADAPSWTWTARPARSAGTSWPTGRRASGPG